MKKQGKVREWKGSEGMAETLNKPFDPEAAHAASVMKDEAVIISDEEKTQKKCYVCGNDVTCYVNTDKPVCGYCADSGFPVGEIDSPIIETNERGGKQSKIKGRMTEVPPLALIEVSAVMAEGARNYPRNEDGTPNWHSIDCASNLDHAMEHVANFLAERNKPPMYAVVDTHDMYDSDHYRDKDILREELSHAASRMMMALEQFIREEV